MKDTEEAFQLLNTCMGGVIMLLAKAEDIAIDYFREIEYYDEKHKIGYEEKIKELRKEALILHKLFEKEKNKFD